MPFIGETSIRTGASSAGGADLGDPIENSIRLNDNDTAHMRKTFSGAGDDGTRGTIRLRVKRGNLGSFQHFTEADGTTPCITIRFTTSDQIQILDKAATAFNKITTRVFRDTTGWYDLCISWNTNDATAEDRIQLEVNGVRETSFGTNVNPGSAVDLKYGSALVHTIGGNSVSTPTFLFDGLIAEFYYIDGLTKAASDFGRFSTTDPTKWVESAYTGAFGTNGFHLDFQVAPGTGNGAGTDVSGNGNHFTDSGLTADDQLSDTPTNVFCALSPVNAGSAMVLSEASLRVSVGTSQSVGGTFLLDGMLSYWEVEAKVTPNNGVVGIGRDFLHTANFVNTGIHGIYATANQWYSDGSNLTTPTHASISSGDRLMFAFDEPNGKLYVGLNGTWLNSGDPAAGTGAVFTGLTQGGYVPYFGTGTSPTNDYHFSFGQDTTNIASAVSDGNGYGNFEYTPPTGFLALCQANLPNVVTDLGGVDKPSESVQLITASGDNIVSDLDAALASGSFLKIYKNIDTGSTAWKWVFPDDTGNMWDSSVNTGKATYSAPSGSDTFAGIGIKIDTSVGTASSEVSHTNGVATNYAHGLGVTPSFVILFPNLTANKRVFHSALDSGKLIRLDDQQAQATDSSFTVDATNVTISSSLATGDYRILAFAEIDGFSSFKFHDSNSSADGPFLHHGFSPLFEITVDIDLTDTALDWDLFSYKLESHSGNVLDQKISLNEKNAKSAIGYSGVLDHVSTGSKTRTSGSVYNTSSRHHARVAFAQAAIGGGIPFPNAR